MPKEEWGVKRLCPTTGKRFYDMNRSPIVSPYTGEVVEIDTGRKSTAALTQAAKTAKPAPKEDQTDDDAVILDEDEDTADVDLGDDVLDDEDDNDNVSLDDLADVASNDEDD
ncbi:MAG: TIGR02300 family protein [Dinoroseobacter sp.]|nr:TIGR02300 family protein [Dinoroseobacter sp.]